MQVGTWSRWLTDLFGIDADDSMTEVQINGEDGEIQGENDEPKSFHLLNALSDLLMLPKDMLMDRSIRKEVRLIIIDFLFKASNVSLLLIFLVMFLHDRCAHQSAFHCLKEYFATLHQMSSALILSLELC